MAKITKINLVKKATSLPLPNLNLLLHYRMRCPQATIPPTQSLLLL
jgi:hypothetical protein